VAFDDVVPALDEPLVLEVDPVVRLVDVEPPDE